MMTTQLTTDLLFRGAARQHRHSQVVSRLPSGGIHRYTLGEFADRTRQLMNALDRLGVARGARVATLAWNGYRHLEAYFAVPNSGRVLHTLNVRLSPDELVFIMNDAQDEAVLVDADLVPIIEKVADQIPTLEHVIVMGDAATSLGAHNYEQLIAAEGTDVTVTEIDENTACGLCYTSGTTGRPKGVTYTHRSTFLHALAVSSHAGMSVGPGDCVLPQVPMFHANAWGLPYASVAVGAKLCLYGGALEAASFADLIYDERVTVSGAVPSVWISLAAEFASRPAPPTTLRHLVCGGSQPPRSLIERYARDFGVPVVQAWGMTETSPLASVSWPHHHLLDLEPDELTERVRTQAGLPLPGVELSIRGEDGAEVAADGSSMGALHVRGPWVADAYLHDAGAENFTADGWFHTGDVAIASPDGYFVIADRTKDLIKSGGEWISSVDMEAAIMAMPGVREAAVIAIPDPQWIERPMAYAVTDGGAPVSLDDVRAALTAAGFAKWQLPDRVEFIDDVPKTTVGKFDKKLLRDRFASGN